MPSTVLTGLDVLLRDRHPLAQDGAIGLVTNPTAVTRDLVSAVDALHQDDRFHLVRLFGPEHGVRGDAQAGDHIGNAIDITTGLEVISMYGDHLTPTLEDLDGIEVMVYDLQDVGARHYTYLSTLVHVMQACAEAAIPLVVLDRPNPITGLHTEGKVLDSAYESFVGIHAIPTRHGLTIGELALLIAADRTLPTPAIVPCEGWTRDQWWDETDLPFVLPSPNLPTLDSLLVYTATCLLEATNLSEGRGTTKPFEMIGAPWLNGASLAAELNARQLPGVTFRALTFTPWFSKHQGIPCGGVQLHVTNREVFRPVSTGIHLLHALCHLPDSQFQWLEGPVFGMSHARLYGSTELQMMLTDGATAEEIVASWQPELDQFVSRASTFHLYPTGGQR
ncbi:MAG: DUF1343 domain-containing protein [Thermomicrobiales bacterium]|nr:DUF1343 domain-containing protein [Thermomicrobiales bacterium]